MNTFDIVIIVLLLIGFIRGFSKGLFMELASLVALVAGIYGAIYFSYIAEGLLLNYVDWEDNYISIAAFGLTFLVIILIISLVGRFFTKVADAVALGFLNKLLGGAFGVLKFALLLSVVFIVFDKLNKNLPFVSDDTTKDATLFEPVRDFAPLIFQDFLTVEDVEDQIKELNEPEDNTPEEDEVI
ncbi:hypothetical protein KH5_07070 [Urechidicola sp. KH5]